jgi:hypothetical protein
VYNKDRGEHLKDTQDPNTMDPNTMDPNTMEPSSTHHSTREPTDGLITTDERSAVDLRCHIDSGNEMLLGNKSVALQLFPELKRYSSTVTPL